MGEEIASGRFAQADFDRFQRALRAETEILRSWFRDQAFGASESVAGYELEACLTDAQFEAIPQNEVFLSVLGSESVVPELSRFNVEFNAPPLRLADDALRRMQDHLFLTWSAAQRTASSMGMRLAMIGILPTIRQDQLTLANMSDRERYRALNEQVLRMRDNAPMRLDIQGRERLTLAQSNVMLESAATSFQIHLQVNPSRAVRYYNAAKAVSGPIVAATCNSPYLFGKDLWAETRIPLFEQAVSTTDRRGAGDPATPRVSFGDDYVQESIMELFDRNVARYPILLPAHVGDDPVQLGHLRLHNGTIWRWNRPLIGFESDGRPHLRIEHRVVPAGPTVVDSIANAALFLGLVHALVETEPELERRLPFERARRNFYRAARDGLDAEADWLDGTRGAVTDLLLEDLVPRARRGLALLHLDTDQTNHYMEIIENRIRRRRTGTDWQREFVAAHDADMTQLTAAYWDRQESGRPVCEWDV